MGGKARTSTSPCALAVIDSGENGGFVIDSVQQR